MTTPLSLLRTLIAETTNDLAGIDLDEALSIIASVRDLAANTVPSTPRLLITIDGGLVDIVAIEGLDDVEIELVKIDLDTDGSDEEDGCLRVEGDLMWVSVGTVDRMSPDEAHLARTARDTWAMT